jgi:hypothetical protein
MIGRIGNYIIGILLGTAMQSANSSGTRLVMAFPDHSPVYLDMASKIATMATAIGPCVEHQPLPRARLGAAPVVQG